MSVTTTEKRRPHYNPAVLRWARKLAGVSLADVALSVEVKEEQVAEWEREEPKKAPTVLQARKLANLYKRPFLEFFRRTLPDLPDPVLIPDFRLFQTSSNPLTTKKHKEIQLWAETQRINALDLYSEIGEHPLEIPKTLFQTVKADHERAAEQARAAINFPIMAQVDRSTVGRRRIPGEIRRKIEAIGVLVFRRTDLTQLRVRGFCIAVSPLPIIVVGSEIPTAEAFTLGHEFAHVLIRQTALSGAIPRTGGNPSKRRVEEWCNRFASAFLMPRDTLQDYLDFPSDPFDEISDEALHRTALYFGVSDHAMLIRLVHLRYVKSEYYWQIKKPQFDREESEYRGFGRSAYYGTRYRNTQGDLYTGLVLEAWGSGRITNHHAAEYMGIKNIQHVLDIRDHYRSG